MLLAAGFLQEHRGFRLHRLISEVMNEEERVTYAEASGAWRIISEFSEFYAAHTRKHFGTRAVPWVS